MENLAWAFLHAINVLVQVCSYARNLASHNISIHLGENKLNVNDGSQLKYTNRMHWSFIGDWKCYELFIWKKVCGENEWTINANASLDLTSICERIRAKTFFVICEYFRMNLYCLKEFSWKIFWIKHWLV